MRSLFTGSAWMLALVGLAAVGTPAFSRELTALVPCKVTMTAKSSAYSNTAYSSAYTSAFPAEVFKEFCKTGVYVPDSPIVATATATANAALAKATAEAYNVIVATGTISGACSAGSWAGFSASATSRALAKAASQSYAEAFARVVGYQAYALIQAEVQAYAQALQSVCADALLTSTTNGMLSCVKTTKTCPCTTCAAPSLSTCKPTCPCNQMECKFGRTDKIKVVAESSAQAIAKAIALVTSTPGKGICTYNGNVETCRQFTELCSAVCNPEEDICVSPVTIVKCATGFGDYEQVADGSYHCKPICDDEQVPSPTFTGGSNAPWTCSDPPAMPLEPLTRTEYEGYYGIHATTAQAQAYMNMQSAITSIEVKSIPEQVLAQFGTKRWVGRITPPESGDYEFQTTSDDGSLVWINGDLVVDNGNEHTPVTKVGSVNLEVGVIYDIDIIAGNNVNPGTMIMNWRKAGDAEWQNDLSPLLLVGEALYSDPPPV